MIRAYPNCSVLPFAAFSGFGFRHGRAVPARLLAAPGAERELQPAAEPGPGLPGAASPPPRPRSRALAGFATAVLKDDECSEGRNGMWQGEEDGVGMDSAGDIKYNLGVFGLKTGAWGRGGRFLKW